MALVRQCEMQGFRLTRVMQSVATGEPEVGMVSLLIAALLRSAGASVSDDDVGAVLLNADRDTVRGLMEPVMQAFVWEPDEKKREAPSAA